MNMLPLIKELVTWNLQRLFNVILFFLPIKHCIKIQNFTEFRCVEILRKNTIKLGESSVFCTVKHFVQNKLFSSCRSGFRPNDPCVKGTPLQIWKSPNMFMFVQKKYPENFAFVILRIILELFAREVRKCLKW